MNPRIQRETAKACAFYPSTTFHVVPLPHLPMGRISYSRARHLSAATGAGSSSASIR
jgi:hypothetical protein